MVTHNSTQRTLSMRGLLNVVLFAVVVALVGLVWLQVAKTLTKTVPPAPIVGQPKAVAWGAHVFPNRAGLEAWLRERGIAYSVWAARHPAGVSLIEHRAIHASTGVMAVRKPATRVAIAHKEHATAAGTPRHASRQPAPAKTRPVAPRVSPTTATVGITASTAGSGSRQLMRDLLWVIALLVFAIAFIPTRLVARYSRVKLLPEHRTILAAAAVAMAVGILAAGSL